MSLRAPAWVWVVVVSTLTAALAFMVGVSIGTPNHPKDGSADVGFARDMSVHHAQAVEMSLVQLQNSDNERLSYLAKDIALTQQGQIGAMSTWLGEWNVPRTSRRAPMDWMGADAHNLMTDDGRMPGMASDAEIAALRAARGKASDILYCQLMIDHHLGGIHMAEAALKKAKDKEVREFALRMKEGQQGEVNLLIELLNGLGAKPRSA